MKISAKLVPERDLPSQEDFESLTREQTKRIVSGAFTLDQGSTVAKRNSIPRVMPIIDLNFPARRRLSR